MWNIWIDVKLQAVGLHLVSAGEWSRPAELHLTKLSAVSWGYHSRRPVTYLHNCDHLLFRVCFHSIFTVWWWEEAQPKNLHVVLCNFLHSCRNLSTYFILHWLWKWCLFDASRSFHRPIPVRYNWNVFARTMHFTSEFAKIVLSKCVCVCRLILPGAH